MAFYPAKHHAGIIRLAQWGNALDLYGHHHLHVPRADLRRLTALPPRAGVILVANHADEMDIRVCLEVARRARRGFTFMINAEAFEEGRGLAGWWLQRLGGFSVERGGSDQAARRYAVEVVKAGREVLVAFPEGEIHYLNDLVQPFKTGAVHFGLQALGEMRPTWPAWTAYLVPMAIKYCYRGSVGAMLGRRLRKMERHLFQRVSYLSLQERLARIMAERLHQQGLLDRTQKSSQKLARLKAQVEQARAATLADIEARYRHTAPDPKAQLADRAHRMAFFLRQQLARKKLFSLETRRQLQEDLRDLQRTIQMAGWQPHYTALHPSEERLAETLMQLERDVFKRRRPRTLGPRDVFLRLAAPLDLGPYQAAYAADPSACSHRLAEQLRDIIQTQLEEMAYT